MTTPAPSANIQFANDINNNSVPLNKVVYVIGETTRGKILDPSELISTLNQFRKKFGPYTGSNDFALHCERLIQRGAVLRICNIKDTATAVVAEVTLPLNDDGDLTLKFTAKNAGVDYNNVVVTLLPPSDLSLTKSMNIEVEHILEGYTELYENLWNPFDMVNLINTQSNWVNVELIDTDIDWQDITDDATLDWSALTTGIGSSGGSPSGPYFNSDPNDLIDGLDGTAVTDGDYTIAKFQTFNPYADSYFILTPAKAVPAINTVGEAYAASRMDLRFYASLGLTGLDDINTTIAKRDALPVSQYINYSAGGWQILDPLTNLVKNILEQADFVANAVNVFASQAEWFSFSGLDNVVPNVLGPVVNYGTPAEFVNLDLLNRAQINMAVNRSGLNVYWGNFSGQKLDNTEKFISTNNLKIYIIKTLKPTLETFLEKPLDITLFKTIFYTVKPFFESIKTGRAISSWEWKGDQNASTPSDFVINEPADVQAGKYKVECKIYRISPLQELNLNIVFSTYGVNIS